MKTFSTSAALAAAVLQAGQEVRVDNELFDVVETSTDPLAITLANGNKAVPKAYTSLAKLKTAKPRYTGQVFSLVINGHSSQFGTLPPGDYSAETTADPLEKVYVELNDGQVVKRTVDNYVFGAFSSVEEVKSFFDAASDFEQTTQDIIDQAVTDNIAALNALVQGSLPFDTKADLDLYTPTANTDGFYPLAKVLFDPALENNGVYGYTGGAWTLGEYESTLQYLIGQASVAEKTTKTVTDAGISAVTDIDLVEVDTDKLRGLKQLLSFGDPNGNSAFSIDEEGSINIRKLYTQQQLFGNTIIEGGEYNYDIAIADENGNVLSGTIAGVVAKSNVIDSAKILSRDNKNKESSRTKSAVGYYARPFFDLNHIVVYGQSLSTGFEGWPALSKTQQRGCLMLGDCVRPSSGGDPVFIPIGVEQLNPLIANVNNGSTILTDAEVAALPAGSGREGETVNFGMANAAARAQQRAFNNSGVVVTTNSGVAGKTIEQLSKTNTQDSTNRYNRFVESVRKVQTLATADTKTHGVTAIVWMQGEWNYSDHGGSWDKATYKTLFKQLFDDMRADAITETGQEDPPIFITYQTGDSYTRDVDSSSVAGLSIGEAQWETAQENTGMYLAGPIYAYTDKGGHMDSNGYRWYGNLLAKVYEKVVIKGEDWKPLHPLSATYEGTQLIIDFYVPEPPLVFDVSYDANVADMYETKGFRITDSTGDEILITNVEIIGDTVVKINTATTITSGCKVWYASKTNFSGNGNLRDSDPNLANDIYEYLPGSGMYESANIPELVNKPYPMHNWCIAFTLTLEDA